MYSLTTEEGAFKFETKQNTHMTNKKKNYNQCHAISINLMLQYLKQ